MVRIGYFLCGEEFGPREVVDQAKKAEQACFERLWISDHFHPWLDEQGHSPFVWSVIGALSEATTLPITTAVTCPLIRIHPAIIAQAAVTAAVQCEGRFTLGVGSGEALNEHITCTILLDGRRVTTCLTFAVAQDGAEVVTAAGLADGADLHPMQRAFLDHDGFQCGYCTPGQICSAVGMLTEVVAGWPSVVTRT
jgi:hypothetical protein